MKIGIVVRIGIPIAKDAKGYYYRIYHLVEGLYKRGHQVSLLAHPKSKISGELIKATNNKITFENQLYYYSKFFKKFGNKLDVINCQTDHVCTFFDDFIKTPVLHTVIYGSFWQEVEEVLKLQKGKKYSTISKAMLKRYPYLNWQGVVYNGIDTKKFTFNKNPKDYYLFLGKVNKNKGADVAIHLAKKLGIKLYLAGTASEEFYKKEIKPFLSSKIKYLGDLNFKDKIQILKNALALIHPHQHPEAFGNVFIEAMSCGTPVITLDNGSPKEIISHRIDGWVAKNRKELIEGIKKIKEIDRSLARKKVEAKFTLDKMIDGYEKLYFKIANKK